MNLPTKENMSLVSKYENEILDLIYHWEDYTTSDLQGCVSAIVMKILRERK